MKHTHAISQGALAAACDDYAEYDLSDWLDGDERQITVYFKITQPMIDDDYPTVDTIGAVVEGENHYTEAITAADLRDMIGAAYVDRLEQRCAEDNA